MLTFKDHSVGLIKDAFGILTGKRYEFMIDVEVEEDDELYSENGLSIRVIYIVDEDRIGIVKYELFERTTNRYIELDLEEDELEAVDAFCREHLNEVAK